MSIIHQFITINEHQRIGEIILDNPKSLNAQTYDMVKTTSELLSTWADDASVVAVLMRGAGQKAFCAGGDIRGLYHAYNSEIFPNPEPLKFFRVEYGLCKQINSYAKPIIVWASGIVMGGGMGLATPCSHRIVSETTMMAVNFRNKCHSFEINVTFYDFFKIFRNKCHLFHPVFNLTLR